MRRKISVYHPDHRFLTNSQAIHSDRLLFPTQPTAQNVRIPPRAQNKMGIAVLRHYLSLDFFIFITNRYISHFVLCKALAQAIF